MTRKTSISELTAPVVFEQEEEASVDPLQPITSEQQTLMNVSPTTSKVSTDPDILKENSIHEPSQNQKRKFDCVDEDRPEHHPYKCFSCVSSRNETQKWISLLEDCIKDYRQEISEEEKKLKLLNTTLQRLEKTQAATNSDDDDIPQGDQSEKETSKVRQIKMILLYQQLIEYAKQQLDVIQSSTLKGKKKLSPTRINANN